MFCLVDAECSSNMKIDLNLKLCSSVECKDEIGALNPRVSLCRRECIIDCCEELGKMEAVDSQSGS